MKASSIVLGIACLCFSQLTLSQNPTKTGFYGIPGYFDPASGAFSPFNQPLVTENSLSAAAASPSTGKFVVNFTIAIRSSIPTAYPISCDVAAYTTEIDASYNVSMFNESASVVATRVSATSATCTVTIPYSWPLLSPSTDKVSLSYSISTQGTTNALSSRTSNLSIGKIAVPANNATTTKTVSAVI